MLKLLVEKWKVECNAIPEEWQLFLLLFTSGAGSRASAEQFVGSYDLVEFTLVLVGGTIR